MAELRSRRKKPMSYAAAPVSAWGRLAQYHDKTALEFPSEDALDAVIETLWVDPSLRDVPRAYANNRTMIVPTESIALFRAKGFSFTEIGVVSAGSPPQESLAASRA